MHNFCAIAPQNKIFTRIWAMLYTKGQYQSFSGHLLREIFSKIKEVVVNGKTVENRSGLLSAQLYIRTEYRPPSGWVRCFGICGYLQEIKKNIFWKGLFLRMDKRCCVDVFSQKQSWYQHRIGNIEVSFKTGYFWQRLIFKIRYIDLKGYSGNIYRSHCEKKKDFS